MASMLPSMLLRLNNGRFDVFYTSEAKVRPSHFDIISHVWGDEVDPYNPSHYGIAGVPWQVTVDSGRLEEVKRLMRKAEVKFLWMDCLCTDQENTEKRDVEIAKMYEYYKSARNCYILMGMPKLWSPQDIVDNLQFVHTVRSNMVAGTRPSEATGISRPMIDYLATWAMEEWVFDMSKSRAMSTAIDVGLLNCYATCIHRVKSLFDNAYFSRVWTFQEMILGNNITIWGTNAEETSIIGELEKWTELAIESSHQASELRKWILSSKSPSNPSVSELLRLVELDEQDLMILQTMVQGINSARIDIRTGGPNWWRHNHKGISNIFSAVSLTPRRCKKKQDYFKGLLGIFSGMFTPEEITREFRGEDMDRMSLVFFKQLSIKTRYAWTKLTISNKERGEWDWIPETNTNGEVMTTDCFAGVLNLGSLDQQTAQARAVTGITGTPRKYMNIQVGRTDKFQFHFKGCNCGKKEKTGTFRSRLIATNDEPHDVVRDETGRMLVQCATILASIVEPNGDLVAHRQRILEKLQPDWNTSDPDAKPLNWIDRCVSGNNTWEKPIRSELRVHNQSMNYIFRDLTRFGFRLANGNTANLSCSVRVSCGCTIVAPFSLMFAALTTVDESSLGEVSVRLDNEGRITCQDGLGLVQIGDVGKSFDIIAFGGDVASYQRYAKSCRKTRVSKQVFLKKGSWPIGRAFVRQEFSHNITNKARDYGYVDSDGSGNLLICKNNPLGRYKIIGVCIDEVINNRGKVGTVNIR